MKAFDDNLKIKNEIIIIIHGIGSGIIRKATINTLNRNKNVEEYKSDYSNRGCTIVKLKTDN